MVPLLRQARATLRTGSWRAVAGGLIVLQLAFAGTQGRAECRQALALGLDVSGSVDSREYRLQLDGLAAALQSDAVSAILLSSPGWPVRLAIYEWSGPRTFNRRLIVNWQDIATQGDLDRVTARLRATARRPADPSTALGAAMQYGADLLAAQSDCPKRTLDISGDGKSNTGPRPAEIAVPDWLTINGLVIASPRRDQLPGPGELSAYYAAYVLHGPDAFVETAAGFEDFEAAMTRKLLRELQGLSLAALQQTGGTP